MKDDYYFLVKLLMNYSLTQYIDEFITNHMWSPNLTDDENIDNIISYSGNKGNRQVLRWLVIEDIKQKIINGIYHCEPSPVIDE